MIFTRYYIGGKYLSVMQHVKNLNGLMMVMYISLNGHVRGSLGQIEKSLSLFQI